MSRFLIKLTPLTPYFFGGENTFGDGKINYFARSNYLPQQTTLLGMLRHQLLIQNDLIGTDPITNDWKSLIGTDSFQKKDEAFVTDFGAILEISPVFLAKDNSYFTTQTLDWAFSDSRIVAPVIMDFDTTEGFAMFGDSKELVPKLMCGSKFYDPKLGLKSLWVDSAGERFHQWDFDKPKDFTTGQGFENGVFIPHIQIGIHRVLERRRTDKGDFYKQVSYKLLTGYSFAFFADINLPEGKKFSTKNIIMGGEKTVIHMDVSPAKNLSFENVFTQETFKKNHSRKHQAVILMSDSYCDDSILDNCSFSINDSVNFKNITTQQRAGINYAAFRNEGVTKSSTNLKLFKRGSVLYPKEGQLSLVEDAIRNAAFSKIGYNKYLVINT